MKIVSNFRYHRCSQTPARFGWYVLALILSAVLCGKALAQKPSKHILNIVYIGGSITYGVLLPNRSVQSPPATCTKALATSMHGTSIYMSSQGRNGHTTVDFLPSTGTDFPRVERAASQLETDHPGILIFSVMLGTNDSASSGPSGAPVSPRQYATNLSRIFNRLLQDFPGSIIVVQRPIWYSPNIYNAADYEAQGLRRLQSYFPVIDSIVKRFARTDSMRVYEGNISGFRYFAAHHLALLTPQQGHRGIFYLHPNVQGAVILGNLWASAIKTAFLARSQNSSS